MQNNEEITQDLMSCIETIKTVDQLNSVILAYQNEEGIGYAVRGTGNTLRELLVDVIVKLYGFEKSFRFAYTILEAINQAEVDDQEESVVNNDKTGEE